MNTGMRRLPVEAEEIRTREMAESFPVHGMKPPALMNNLFTSEMNRIIIDTENSRALESAQRLVIIDSEPGRFDTQKAVRVFNNHRKDSWLTKFLLEAGEDEGPSDLNSSIKIAIHERKRTQNSN